MRDRGDPASFRFLRRDDRVHPARYAIRDLAPFAAAARQASQPAYQQRPGAVSATNIGTRWRQTEYHDEQFRLRFAIPAIVRDLSATITTGIDTHLVFSIGVPLARIRGATFSPWETAEVAHASPVIPVEIAVPSSAGRTRRRGQECIYSLMGTDYWRRHLHLRHRSRESMIPVIEQHDIIPSNKRRRPHCSVVRRISLGTRTAKLRVGDAASRSHRVTAPRLGTIAGCDESSYQLFGMAISPVCRCLIADTSVQPMYCRSSPDKLT